VVLKNNVGIRTFSLEEGGNRLHKSAKGKCVQVMTAESALCGKGISHKKKGRLQEAKKKGSLSFYGA